MAMSIKTTVPSDIINIILQYTNNNIIIQLQDYFPNSLKYITINEKELELINKNNYQYIRKLDCYASDMTDKGIQCLTQLSNLNCGSCYNISDNGIQHITQEFKEISDFVVCCCGII
jgi:hypothetical protein